MFSNKKSQPKAEEYRSRHSSKSEYLLLVATLLLTSLGSLSAHAGPHPVSTLIYSGYLNGSVAFHSALCSIVKHAGGNVINVSAPTYYKAKVGNGRFVGPILEISFLNTIRFCPNQYRMTHKNTFIYQVPAGHDKVNWEVNGGRMIVSINSIVMHNFSPGSPAIPHKQQGKLTLRGRIICTDNSRDLYRFINHHSPSH